MHDPLLPDDDEYGALIDAFPKHRDDLIQVEPCPGGEACALHDPGLRNGYVLYNTLQHSNAILTLLGVMKAHGDRMEADRMEVAFREFFDTVAAYAATLNHETDEEPEATDG